MSIVSPDLDEFRDDVRAFFKANVSERLSQRVQAGNYLTDEENRYWQRALAARGWGVPNWPREYGGAEWSAEQTYIYEEEAALAGAPSPFRVGPNIVGPMIMRHGTDEQKKRFLPPIVGGGETWALGFSEPDAGSDLANLSLKAERQGNHYLVNGTKIWTSAAHKSDRLLLLARTSRDATKHVGISIFLADLKAPGIDMRAIPTIDGNRHFNQLFFENVKIPTSLLLGEQDNGWNIMNMGFGAERLFLADVGRSKALMLRLKRIARSEQRGGRPLLEHPAFQMRVALLEVRLHALDFLVLRFIKSPELVRALEASVLKLRGTELAQDITQLMSEAAGLYAVPYHRDVLEGGWVDEPIGPDYAATLTPFYLFWRKASISGGTSEIQKNIIAKSLLA